MGRYLLLSTLTWDTGERPMVNREEHHLPTPVLVRSSRTACAAELLLVVPKPATCRGPGRAPLRVTSHHTTERRKAWQCQLPCNGPLLLVIGRHVAHSVQLELTQGRHRCQGRRQVPEVTYWLRRERAPPHKQSLHDGTT